MKRIKPHFIVLFMAAALLPLSSCTDYLEIDPPDNRIGPETLFQEPEAILALVNDLYTKDGGSSGSTAYLSFFLDVAADDIMPSSQPGSYRDLSNNVYDSESDPLSRWKTSYRVIYTANNLLDHLPGTQGVLSDKLRAQYQAEALFMRAYSYFHLVNLYGAVPLIQTTNPEVSISMGRTPVEEVQMAIVEDIQRALDLAPDDFSDPYRANRWAMKAFLARVYLFQENWAGAEAMATEVIEDSPFSLVTDLSEVFLPDSPGGLWVPPLGETTSIYNDKILIFSMCYIPLFPGVNPEMVAREGLVNAFEAGDQRLEEWMANYGTFYAPYKYINGLFTATRVERLLYLRMGEQYLIRAEARAQQENITGANSAASDLNIIRNRAGLGGTTATSREAMLDAIMHERRVELFSEGHRWYDLKRTGEIDAVLGALKDTWEPYKKLFPIPQEELNANPNLEPNW